MGSSSKKKICKEDIAEYLANKAHKKAMKVANMLKTQTVSGYANESNPFGDSNINQTFVWRKKIERDVSQGVSLDTYSVKAEKKRHKERMAEIEKVKKRREERSIEKAQHEEKMALLARQRARAEFQDLEKKEEEFHFEQSKVRSEIRLREGRIKPIDVLLKHLNPSDDFDIEIEEPYMVFKGLTLKELEELHDDIKMHLDLDKTHIEYWEALEVVCDWELAESRKKDAFDRARVYGEEPPVELLAEERGLHSSIEADVKNLLQGKTYAQLEKLQTEIESQMRSGTAKVVEYWEAVIKRLNIYKAKACLKVIHAKMLRKRLEQPLGSESLTPIEEEESYQPLSQERIHAEELPEEEDGSGSFSSELIMHGDETEEEEEAVDHDEVNMDSSQLYWLHDKYRLRKPKYSTRFHTGYEWNKYNQTHYDHQKPPPKMVQGYKFDIFYPDLFCKTEAPYYTIDNDEDSAETCIIQFHAGPPYEDIAFRIVNKEWEYSPKKGFKYTFERGILHLFFNFKRHRYRR